MNENPINSGQDDQFDGQYGHPKSGNQSPTSSSPNFPPPLTELNPESDLFTLEVVKNGTIIKTININKSRFTVGRAPDCDIILEHPSASRYHAVLLWKEGTIISSETETSNPSDMTGFIYLVDLNSTHGTFCNKERIEPGKLIKLQPGNNVVKFGASTRIYMLQSSFQSFDNDDNEMDSDQIKEVNKRKIKNTSNDDVCDWGIKDDDCEQEYENDDGEPVNPVALVLSLLQTGFGPSSLGSIKTENENAYLGNPMKTIQQWFEREGYEFEYQVNYNGKFKCCLTLTLEGQDIPIEGQLMTKVS